MTRLAFALLLALSPILAAQDRLPVPKPKTPPLPMPKIGRPKAKPIEVSVRAVGPWDVRTFERYDGKTGRIRGFAEFKEAKGEKVKRMEFTIGERFASGDLNFTGEQPTSPGPGRFKVEVVGKISIDKGWHMKDATITVQED